MNLQKNEIERINIDKGIKLYNEKNPTLLPMTRKRLATEIGYKTQIFSDWKTGKTPNWINAIDKMINLLECELEDIIDRKNDETK